MTSVYSRTYTKPEHGKKWKRQRQSKNEKYSM